MSDHEPVQPAPPPASEPASPPPPSGDAEEGRDALLERAESIAELPLAERAGAFDGLNRAVVAELQSLEEA